MLNNTSEGKILICNSIESITTIRFDTLFIYLNSHYNYFFKYLLTPIKINFSDKCFGMVFLNCFANKLHLFFFIMTLLS